MNFLNSTVFPTGSRAAVWLVLPMLTKMWFLVELAMSPTLEKRSIVSAIGFPSLPCSMTDTFPFVFPTKIRASTPGGGLLLERPAGGPDCPLQPVTAASAKREMINDDRKRLFPDFMFLPPNRFRLKGMRNPEDQSVTRHQVGLIDILINRQLHVGIKGRVRRGLYPDPWGQVDPSSPGVGNRLAFEFIVRRLAPVYLQTGHDLFVQSIADAGVDDPGAAELVIERIFSRVLVGSRDEPIEFMRKNLIAVIERRQWIPGTGSGHERRLADRPLRIEQFVLPGGKLHSDPADQQMAGADQKRIFCDEANVSKSAGAAGIAKCAGVNMFVSTIIEEGDSQGQGRFSSHPHGDIELHQLVVGANLLMMVRLNDPVFEVDRRHTRDIRRVAPFMNLILRDPTIGEIDRDPSRFGDPLLGAGHEKTVRRSAARKGCLRPQQCGQNNQKRDVPNKFPTHEKSFLSVIQIASTQVERLRTGGFPATARLGMG